MKLKIQNQPFLYISDNSSEIDSSTAFVETTQNSQYREKAKENGATTFLHVKDLFDILDIKNLQIVGITGTNGKTTTAAAIYSLLLDLGYKAALQGTRGCFINDKRVDDKSLTTPSILHTLSNMQKACEEKCSYFVMEVSSHAIVQNRIEELEFALKIFTNISQDHLDFHKNMREYIKAKSSFFDDESKKLINKDDENIKFNIKNAYTYGVENAATYKIEAYSLKNGIEAVCNFGRETFSFSSSLQGKFNLYNILAAISAVHILTKKSFALINEALQDFAGVSGRMEVANENPLVIVDFAHTPDGIEKVLEAMSSKDISVVFGAGGDRDRTKRPLMAKIAKRYAKKIYITSDNPRSEEPDEIIKEIVAGISDLSNVKTNPNRKEAIFEALNELKDKEVLMILGKGDEDYQEIKGVKYHFSDKEIVEEYFKTK
ncbi:MAG: UDP-N-acetylmuramoyl-L-alanyl-D-glutamate--2,6-diaminopimelate ligase [Campylobacteraceae bacterium]